MARSNKTELILKGNLYRVLITLSIPIIINSLIQTLYNLVDGLWVSRISSVHFAATAFVWPVNFLFISLGGGLSIAGTSLLSQLVGGHDLDRAKQYSSQLVAVSLLSSLVFTTLGYLSTPLIVRLMGATGELAELSIIYLRIVFFDMPFVFLYFAINSMLHAQGDTITPMVLSGVSALLNAILDPIFIFTLGWGLAGAAWATVTSRALLASAGFFLLLRGKNKLRPEFSDFRFNKEIISEIVRVGLPSSIGQSGAALGFMALNGFIASYGTATLAAYAMVNRITSLVMQPAMGMGQALTTIVGQNMGADQMARVKRPFQGLQARCADWVVGGVIIVAFDSPS